MDVTLKLTLVTSLFIFFILLFHYTLGRSGSVDPVVDTKVGLIRGLKAFDVDYSMFMGIPYARIDTSNPFGASIPEPRFDNVFEAFYDSTACPQFNSTSNQVVGDLDCLQLNVYVPNKASSENKVPVLLWIHGGSFMQGEASRYNYGPKYLVKKDVILVTINYRVGPYGFMCLDIPQVPGNQGMKDQLNAIRWIRDNIEAFGGDVDKITLFGESAGGISVDLHLLSVHDNLYNNVINQSATSLASTVIEEPDKQAPIKLAENLGYVTDCLDDALVFLVNAGSNSVITATVETKMIFKPCVEQEFDDVEPFITNNWISAPMPKVKDLPILVGFNDKERFFRYAVGGSDFFNNLDIIRDRLVQTFNLTDEELVEMENYIQQYYMGDNKYSQEFKHEIGDFDSDYTYIHPIKRSLRKYLAAEAKNIYLYMFSYSGGRNLIQYIFDLNIDGALHADELGYLFDHIFMTEEPNLEDQKVIDQMTTMWANFAKFSDPTPETSDLLPVKWPAISEDEWPYLSIGTTLSVSSRPLHARMAFWDLFYRLNEKKQKGYIDMSTDVPI